MIGRFWPWFLGKASIRKKLVYSFALLVSIPVVLLGIYSFSQSKKNIDSQIRTAMESNLTRLASEIDTRLQKENDFTKILAYNLNFRSALEIAPKDPVRFAQELNTTVEPVFWYFISSDSYMKSIQVYSPFLQQPIGPFMLPDAAVSGTPWYSLHKDHFQTIWSVEEDHLYATRSVLDTATSSRMIGVMRTEFFPASLLSSIESMDYLGNGVLVVDAQGQTIYRKPSSSPALDDMVNRLIAGTVTQEGCQRVMRLHTEELDTTDWQIYYYIDRAEGTKQLTPILKSTLMVVGLCTLITFVLISVLSKTLARRILLLKSSAEQVARGDFRSQALTTDTDEIGIVFNSIVSMTDQLREMIDRVYKMEIEKKTAELQALQAMINPHFLYNCLSSIKWMALYSGEEEIAQSASLIAKFYRTTLNAGQQLTTVRNELENIRAYIEIQQKMHEGGFDARYEIDETHLEEQMLNFLLQPIVENAIVHGLDYLEGERGVLLIRYRAEPSHHVFEVLNNGPRIALDRLEDILGTPGKGYGIYNIRQRIALYYGAGSGMEISITPEGYTCFTVTLTR